MNIVDSYIHLRVTPPDEATLVKHAQRIFKKFDAYADKRLPFDDYDLRVVLEEGSVKGKANIIVATTAGLIYLVEHYGSIVQGAREIANTAKAVAEYFHEATVEEVSAKKAVVKMKRSNAGDLDILNGLIHKVQRRQLTREEGLELALDIFSRSGQLSIEVEAHIRHAFTALRLEHEQGTLELDVPARDAPSSQSTPRPNRESRIPQTTEFVVEIRRKSKSGKERIKKRRKWRG